MINTTFHGLSRLFIVLFAMGIVMLNACKKDEPDMFDCSGVTPTYTSDIKAILDTNCALSGCHAGPSPQLGIDLSTYASASTISMEDRFLGAVQHKSGFEPMPYQLPKLPDAEIELLTCWVQNGSPQ